MSNNKNFHLDIDPSVRARITYSIAKNLNAEALLVVRESTHPEDWFLYSYMAVRGSDLIVGTANVSRDGEVSLYNNSYGLDLQQALLKLADKIYCI